MNWLKIRNSGELALEALFLLGASTKRGDDSKIGFFGSGNKYALAVLLRLGVPLRIFSGEREVLVDVTPVDFRGQVFGQISVDGQPTSFTTSMGPTWEPWFAVREFLCNAIDEGGAAWDLVDDADGEEAGLSGETGTTTICVGIDRPELEDFVEHMDEYIREPGREALVHIRATTYKGPCEIDVFGAPGGRKAFYRRGVLITAHDTHDTAHFAYDFDRAEINESRIASSEWDLLLYVKLALAGCTDPAVVETVLRAQMDEDNESVEGSLNFEGTALSETWCDVLKEYRGQIAPQGMRSFLAPEDAESLHFVPDGLYDQLKSQFKDALDLRTESSQHQLDALGEEDEAFLNDALEDLGRLGYATTYAFIPVQFRDETVGAETNREEAKIRLSSKLVRNLRGTGDATKFKAILLEEIMHTQGFSDGSRAFESELTLRLMRALETEAATRKRLAAVKALL